MPGACVGSLHACRNSRQALEESYHRGGGKTRELKARQTVRLGLDKKHKTTHWQGWTRMKKTAIVAKLNIVCKNSVFRTVPYDLIRSQTLAVHT